MLAPFDRPLAAHVLGAGRRPLCRSMVVPPQVPVRSPAVSGTSVCSGNVEVARFLAQALLAETVSVKQLIDRFEASVDELVEAWSPSLHTTSRNELLSALVEGDDSIVDTTLTIVGEGCTADTVYVEWMLAGRFGKVGFLNDDVLIEPTGHAIETAGVSVFTFDEGRVVRICTYYDGFALLEQVLAGHDADDDPVAVTREV